MDTKPQDQQAVSEGSNQSLKKIRTFQEDFAEAKMHDHHSTIVKKQAPQNSSHNQQPPIEIQVPPKVDGETRKNQKQTIPIEDKEQEDTNLVLDNARAYNFYPKEVDSLRAPKKEIPTDQYINIPEHRKRDHIEMSGGNLDEHISTLRVHPKKEYYSAPSHTQEETISENQKTTTDPAEKTKEFSTEKITEEAGEQPTKPLVDAQSQSANSKERNRKEAESALSNGGQILEPKKEEKKEFIEPDEETALRTHIEGTQEKQKPLKVSLEKLNTKKIENEARLDPLLKRERSLEATIVDLDEKAAATETSETRRQLEAARWQKEDERRTLEKEKWEIQKELSVIRLSIREKNSTLDALSRTLKNYQKELADVVDKKKIALLEKELEALKNKKENLELEWINYTDKKNILTKELESLNIKEREFNKKKRELEVEEHAAISPEEEREIEQKRATFELQRQEIEKKQWKIEDTIADFDNHLQSLKDPYQEALKQEDAIRSQISSIKNNER